MKININIFSYMSYCKKLGIKLPNFDREKMLKVTADSPIWVHFGAGNIFRAFIATIQQELLEKGLTNKGIIAAFTVEPKIIDNVWMPHDNISLRVTVSNDGTMEKLIVASISECLFADKSSNDWTRLIEIFKSQSLQIVSFTITEKGYDPKGETMKKIRELLNERKKVGAPPIALVSMDNCINNGDILKKGIGDSNCYDGMSFPLTMIDKITPHPNEEIKKKLETMGVEGLDIIVTEIGTHSSGFVNTEKTQYLVIEDNFPNGRPPLENVGVIFADRKTVNLVEKMKVGACLNPLHFCVAIFGTLLRFNTMADAVCDMDIKRIIEYMGFEEELPIVTDPIIINPRDFLEECINVRFPNTFLPDDPARITTDASAKITTRFEDTIKEYIEKYPTKLENLRMIPLLFAGWIRYLMAIDDDGNSFKLSPDPLLEELIKHVKNIRLGQQFDAHRHVKPILCNRKLFKINVYETPLGKAIEDWFMKLTESRGAVRRTIRLIKKYDSISLD